MRGPIKETGTVVTCAVVVFESTTMKFGDDRFASTLPTPASSIPVTVSSSPI